MTQEEALRLAAAFQADPNARVYFSTRETTGERRPIYRDEALYVLSSRGLLPAVAA